MTSYRCAQHPDQHVTWRGTGCTECAPQSTGQHTCAHCGAAIGRRRGKYCDARCRQGAHHRAIAADRATLETTP